MIETSINRGSRIVAAPKDQTGTSPTVTRLTAKLRTASAGSFPSIEGSKAPSWELVQRIASSRRFGRSPLLANFLLFVTHRSLTGRDADINEQQIGVHVFNRDEQFNRSDDNIVRTYARILRKRLDDYFRNEGREEALIVAIPRGSYVPVFKNRESALAEPASDEPLPDECVGPVANTTMPAPTVLASRFTPLSIAFTVSAVVLATVLTTVLTLTHDALSEWIRAQTPTGRLNHRLWSSIFEANRDTYIVPADGGLVMLESFLPRHINLTDYANGNYRSPDTIRQGLRSLAGSQPTSIAVQPSEAGLPSLVHKVEVLGARRYTSVVDLELTSQLSRLSEIVPARLMIRYARDLRMDDLRTGNLILLGSADSNPWVDIFQSQLNFQFTYGASYGGSPVIVNRHPLAGERATYGSEDSEETHRSYGVIAYLPNLGMTEDPGSLTAGEYGHVLLVEGVNMAGTQAAGALLLSPEQMGPVLERATGSNGVLRPFEVLIDTSNIAANSANTHVLSERVIQD